MEYTLELAQQVLERTPDTLRVLLSNLSDEWVAAQEGPDSWSPRDIVAHLVSGERVDWISRTRTILDHGETRTFEPFDREAFRKASAGKDLKALLNEFAELRASNLAVLEGLHLTQTQLALKGTHPEFGPVTLSQLLSSWVVHDLSHLAQIARVMAKQYRLAVGPWAEYLPIVER